MVEFDQKQEKIRKNAAAENIASRRLPRAH